MKNGVVIRRGTEYLAKKGKNVRTDEAGYCWSEDIQKARVYLNFDSACRTAYRSGGKVRTLKDGRVEE